MELVARLAEFAGEDAARLWVVGGCVRDRLLGRSFHDVDVVVSGAVVFARSFARAARAAFVLLDDGRGTARVVDRADRDLYLDLCEPQGDLDTDLRRRDFTVNAIACRLTDWCAGVPAWHDPTGGLADLAARRLRVVSEQSLCADPLRVLRAHRLAAVLGFACDPLTVALLRAAAPRLSEMAAERVHQEWWALLAAPAAPAEVERMVESGALAALLPRLDGGATARLRRLDAVAAALDGCPDWVRWCESGGGWPVARFAALLGRARGGCNERELTRRFALSRGERHRLGALGQAVPPEGTSAARVATLVLAATGDAPGALAVSAACGELTRHELGALAAELPAVMARWREAPLVDGKDLQGELGHAPGPKFRTALGRVRDGQLSGELTTRAAALAVAREVLESDG